MSRLELINYIQQNLKNGFKKTEIRSALNKAGWAEGDIETAFFSVGAKKRRMMFLVLLMVITPLIGFGSAWLYSRSGLQGSNQEAERTVTGSGDVAGVITESVEEKNTRDTERVSDVIVLQTALDQFFLTNQRYPENLGALVAQGLIKAIPIDPFTHEPYLYTPLGQPPLYYSISFILELGHGTLGPGFNSASSEMKIQN